MSFFLDGVLADLRALGLDTLVSTCKYYVFAPVHNNQGNVTDGFSLPFILPCRMDSMVNRLVPQRSRDDIDVQKILKSFYFDALNPNGIVFKPKDEIESEAGTPGFVTRYRVLDVAIETDQADIVLLVEVIT